MKVIILLLLCIFLVSCKQLDTKDALALTVLADRTDRASIEAPKLFTIKALCEFTHPLKKSVIFRYQNISDIDFNPVYSVSLPPYNPLENKLKRKGQERSFLNRIDSLLLQENRREDEYHRSSIIVPLVTQLNAIRLSDAKEKKLLLLSDTFEHSEVFNTYDKGDMERLEQSPQQVAEQIAQQLPLEDYTGVSLYIHYTPKTRAQSKRFALCNELYQHLFSGTQLKIYIGTEHYLNTTP